MDKRQILFWAVDIGFVCMPFVLPEDWPSYIGYAGLFIAAGMAVYGLWPSTWPLEWRWPFVRKSTWLPLTEAGVWLYDHASDNAKMIYEIAGLVGRDDPAGIRGTTQLTIVNAAKLGICRLKGRREPGLAFREIDREEGGLHELWPENDNELYSAWERARPAWVDVHVEQKGLRDLLKQENEKGGS